MLLDDVLERNRSFVAGRSPVPLPAYRPFELAVVACYDPRLDPLLLPAMGLKPGDAFLFRSAGALVRPGGPTLRSLGMAMFMFNVTEILVLGHSSCRMASFEAGRFIEAFRGRGVRREAFGPNDLREWAGAIPSARRGVEISVAAILDAPFLPRDVSVSGAVLDDSSGAIEVVPRPGDLPSATVPVAGDEPVPPASPEPAAAGPDEPETAGPTERKEPLIEAARRFVNTLGSQARWRHEVQSLRQSLGQNTGVATKFKILEKLAERVGSNSREVTEAFEHLEREASGTGRPDNETIVRIVQRILGPS